MSNNLSENGGTVLQVKERQYRANELNVAWLAGVIDGEGCLSAHWAGRSDQTSIQTTIWINNTCPKLMAKVQSVLQDITHKKFSICASKHEQFRVYTFYKLQIGAQADVSKVCQAVLPYLTTKRAQAVELIEFCESRKMQRHIVKGYTDYQRGVVERLKLLKRVDLVPYARGVEHKREAPTEGSCAEFLLCS